MALQASSDRGRRGRSSLPSSDPPEETEGGLGVWLVIGSLAALWLVPAVLSLLNPVQTISYDTFEKWLSSDRIQSVRVTPDRIEGMTKGTTAEQTPKPFLTLRVDPDLAQRFIDRGVRVEGAPSSSLLTRILSWVAPALAFYLVLLLLSSRAGSGGGLASYLSVGRSRAKLYRDTGSPVAFDDIAGVDEAKAELREVVEFLKNPKAFGRLGARSPKGILLVGPPGTGKTLMARAVAGEAGVPFFSISGSEFVEMFVGVGAARVRDLFEQARRAAPSIIFIDELDALGRARGSVFLGGYDEKEQTLNQLLAEIDGFDPSSGVILLAATNRPEILDKALLRAGRFDRQVLVDRPDQNGRLAILKVHARKIRLAPEMNLDIVAGLTTGFVGADLANLVNEAAIAATRRNGTFVTLADFESAIERIVAGIEKRSRVLRPSERKRVAVHEMGHALVASDLPSVDPVQKVSIIPRGLGALGYTLQRPSEERFVLSRRDLEERLAVLLGGRAAEALVYHEDVSTGAADDLQHATQIALDMVERYGMAAEIGERSLTPRSETLITPFPGMSGASQDTQRDVDLAVRKLLENASRTAETILTRRKPDLDRGVELLLRSETLNASQFPALMKRSEGDASSASGKSANSGSSEEPIGSGPP
ncbi:MAG: ATP-dependent zinc metalloprotease FtsH [Alphaproteobacteria bacterium]|nr:ATP-dependent zinc metalloprotease FtsH [Alphaproteobacteria bacterium]